MKNALKKSLDCTLPIRKTANHVLKNYDKRAPTGTLNAKCSLLTMNTTNVHTDFRIIRFSRLLHILLCSITGLCCAETYKYIDEHKQIHYSETPSSVYKSEKLSPGPEQVPQDEKADPTTTTPPTAELKAPKQDASDTEKIAYQCQLAKQNLKTLENDPDKLRHIVDGKQVKINEQEQFALIRQQQHNIELYCQ